MNIRTNYDYRDNYNYHPLRKTGSRAEIDMLERETSTQIRVSSLIVSSVYHNFEKQTHPNEDILIIFYQKYTIQNLDMSAGDLLSRTHEELVLLLIQLRRQSSFIARAIEQCCTDIHDVQVTNYFHFCFKKQFPTKCACAPNYMLFRVLGEWAKILHFLFPLLSFLYSR